MKCNSCGAPVENGKCTYCGKVFTIVEDENARMQPKRNVVQKNPFYKEDWFCILMLLFAFPFGLFLMFYYKKFNKQVRFCVTSFFVFLMLISMVANLLNIDSYSDKNINNRNKKEKVESVWLDGYTSLDEFEYYVEGNEIFLTDFNSNKKKVRINSSYEIDGKTYHVVSLDGVFTLGSVTSVIIPEGVRNISNHEFNSCGIKFLYLPSTLQDIGDDTFWWYFHDVEKIYYGGSEEQWNQLCAVERSKIEVEQIIFDTNTDDLK